MICSHERAVQVYDLADVFEEFRGEFSSIVCNHFELKSIKGHPVVDKLLRNVDGGDTVQRRC